MPNVLLVAGLFCLAGGTTGIVAGVALLLLSFAIRFFGRRVLRGFGTGTHEGD